MSRHRLVLDDDYEFLAFGISCHLKDFRVAWHLNQLLGFQFVRKALVDTDRQGSAHAYSRFLHKDHDHHLHYVLLNNFSDGIPLIKSERFCNYFLLVEGYLELFDEDEFVERLQHVSAFQLVTALDNAPLKKYQYSLFEEEPVNESRPGRR